MRGRTFRQGQTGEHMCACGTQVVEYRIKLTNEDSIRKQSYGCLVYLQKMKEVQEYKNPNRLKGKSGVIQFNSIVIWGIILFGN